MLDRDRLREAARHEGGISRRLFLAYAASLAAIPWVGRRAVAADRAVSFATDPFRVGVASGDPTPSGVVLWTRLAPVPFEPGGGLVPENVEVAWEVASDQSMRNIVQRGTSVASHQLAHSVHVEVDGLAPDRWYWYRFRAGDAESPIGRTRTIPVPDSTPDELRFAFASCQHFEHGYFTSYGRMAEDELDVVFHLGDYIYERETVDDPRRIRKHLGKEIESLDDYRIRHAQYKSDRQLQAMHARCPWMVVWDDHEVDNNYANDIPETSAEPSADFLIRRANAYQAYYEMMPLRHTSMPHGPNMQLYRKLSFGRLAEFLVLDTRQYRTDQPNGDGSRRIQEGALSDKGTLMGDTQRAWVEQSLAASPAAWNVLAQQVMLGMVDNVAGEKQRYSMDAWPGYTHERRKLIEYFRDRKIRNPIALTGDIHSNWVNNLRVDDREADTPLVATEFVGTSISSGGNGVDRPKEWATMMAENPCVQFHNRDRGYVRCRVTPEAWQADYRVVKDVRNPDAPAKTRASFVVEAGEAGAKPA